MADKNESADFMMTRIINAPKSLVWKAFTDPEHVVKWWGPTGFKMKVAKLEIRNGGTFHYAMEAPGGQLMWGKITYVEIVPEVKIVSIVTFSDEQGGITRPPMNDKWPLETMSTSVFEEEDGKTKITLRWKAINATEEECAMFDGNHASMTMGMKGTYDQLENYLQSLNA